MGFWEKAGAVAEILLDSVLDNMEKTGNRNANDKKHFNEAQREAWGRYAESASNAKGRFQNSTSSVGNKYDENYLSGYGTSRSRDNSNVSNGRNKEYLSSFKSDTSDRKQYRIIGGKADFEMIKEQEEKEKRQKEKRQKESEIRKDSLELVKNMSLDYIETLWISYGSMEKVKENLNMIAEVYGLLRLKSFDKVIAIVGTNAPHQTVKFLAEQLFVIPKVRYNNNYSQFFSSLINANKGAVEVEIIAWLDDQSLKKDESRIKSLAICEGLRHKLEETYKETIIQKITKEHSQESQYIEIIDKLTNTV